MIVLNIVYNGLFLCLLVGLPLRQAKPSQVSLGETLIGESAIKSVDEIGMPVQYEFRVRGLTCCF